MKPAIYACVLYPVLLLAASLWPSEFILDLDWRLARWSRR